MNSYELSRNFFDWSFENPNKVTPTHIALYFFAIEHCNRLGWKEKFGFPTTMVMDAIGIKSYNTYIKALINLVDWGFIEMIEKSKNQYSANIIALSNNNKANTKALDKALTKHLLKQSESTIQSIDSIDKQYNNITKNKEQEKEEPAQIFQEAEILETTEYKPENGKEKGCAQKESFLPIEELENRFKNYEFQTWEFLMRNFAITREEYDVGVDLFLFEQKDKLEREYSDIHKHLKSFIKLNIKNIKSQNNGKPKTVAGIKVETIKHSFTAFDAEPYREKD